MGRSLEIEWHGRVPYAQALELQASTVEAVAAGRVGDRLLLLEHPPVVTLGRNTRPENLLLGEAALRERGVELHSVPRGGDVTYHAPGQLVGYPILDLRARGEADLHVYLRRIEEALIGALGALGLDGRRVEGRTGVFMTEPGAGAGPARKIASIGVGVRRWVTLHGFALNATIDLAGFEVIVPCGLADVEMTSVARELGVGPLGLDKRVRAAVEAAFLATFA